MNKEDTGVMPFTVMMIVIVFLLIVCVVCPLAIPDFSRQDYAIPLMATGIVLPFVYFFIFGGIALVRSRRK